MTAVPKPALAAGVTTTPVANGRWLLSAGDIGTVTPAVHTPPGGPPYAELDLGAALPLILQFRTLGGLEALIGAAVTARAGLGEAQARHDAKLERDNADRDGWPATWSELPPATAPLTGPDCAAGKHASCVGGPCECQCHDDSPLASPDGTDGLAIEDVPLPDLPHRDPGHALEELAAAEPAAGRTVYPQLSPEALAGETPLETLAAGPEETP